MYNILKTKGSLAIEERGSNYWRLPGHGALWHTRQLKNDLADWKWSKTARAQSFCVLEVAKILQQVALICIYSFHNHGLSFLLWERHMSGSVFHTIPSKCEVWAFQECHQMSQPDMGRVVHSASVCKHFYSHSHESLLSALILSLLPILKLCFSYFFTE